MAPPEVEKSTTPALTIDSWTPAGTPKYVQPPVTVPAVATPAATSRSVAAKHDAKQAVVVPPVSAPAISAPPPVATAPRITMNEMTGTLASIDIDARTLRLSVQGGFNPQFDFNKKTIVESHGRPLKMGDLETDDKIVVRYTGREMMAQEIEKLSGHSIPKR